MHRLDLYRRGRGGRGEAPGRKGAGEPGGGSRERSGRSAPGRTTGILEQLCERLGGTMLSEGGASILEVSESLPPEAVHGSGSLADLFERDHTLQQVLFPWLEKPAAPGGMLFFDLETTGLSGGAGTHIFLAGFLRALGPGEGYRLVQYFLPAYGSERLFLERIDGQICGCGSLVSYNGRAFDAGLIRTRYTMACMADGAGALDALPHLDLLHPCRRIWRGIIENHALGTVERHILGVERGRDIPGWMVPQVYADFLAGRHVIEDMVSVFEHNRSDLLSLLTLLSAQLRALEPQSPEKPAPGGKNHAGKIIGEQCPGGHNPPECNPVQLSRMFVRTRRYEAARRVLTENRGVNEALRDLGLLYKGEHDFGRALECFEELAQRASALEEYLFACTEAAKICEHRTRDLSRALEWTQAMRSRLQRAGVLGGPETGWVARRLAPDVEHRYRRLRTRINKRANL